MKKTAIFIVSFLMIGSIGFASGPPERDKSPTIKHAFALAKYEAISTIKFVPYVFTEATVSATTTTVYASPALKIINPVIPTVAHALRIRGKIYNYSYKKKSVNSRNKQNIRQMRPANI